METREIKFRGQCAISKEMVFGDLIHGVSHKAGNLYILPNQTNLAYVKHCDPLDGVRIIPETVGQFTGLTDKNGKEVYEGDVVKYTRENWHCPGHPHHLKDLTDICTVYWSTTGYSFRQRGVFENGGGWDGDIVFKDDRAKNCTIEVIGNIHENQHLLTPNN